MAGWRTFDVLNAPLACFGVGHYISRLTFWMVSPLCVAVAILLLSAATRPSGSLADEESEEYTRRVLDRAAPWVLRTFFFAYPNVTNVAFSVFDCYDFENGDSFLVPFHPAPPLCLLAILPVR